MAKEKKENDYGPGYLKSENLLQNRQYMTAVVQIKEISPENTVQAADGKLIDKPILWFVGKERGLVANKTNQAVLRSCIGDDDITKAAGSTVTLQVRIVDSFGIKEPAIRIMPPKNVRLRRAIVKRLGTEAVWEGPSPAKTETKPEPTLFEKLQAKIAEKPLEELIADQGTMLTYIAQQNTEGKLTDDEMSQLGAAMNARTAPESEAK
jgi:hypothetical protein